MVMLFMIGVFPRKWACGWLTRLYHLQYVPSTELGAKIGSGLVNNAVTHRGLVRGRSITVGGRPRDKIRPLVTTRNHLSAKEERQSSSLLRRGMKQ
ncbi:hypothetical protein J6590_019122 [Homalodisca vitripennis]|nr:hypothetical protein J6590_019122 [Homalodisca vitripennis]